MAGALSFGAPAQASVFLLLERDTDLAGQTDLFLIGYEETTAFLNNTAPAQAALPQNISANFSAGGLTVDGSGAWHLLLERNTDLAGQTDLFLITYADAAAFLNNADATQTALPQNISANFSAGGLTIDGSGAWHLLLERNTDLAGQTDLFLITYADASAFLNNADATQTALPQNISANFSAGGLTIDGSGAWHLLLERNTDLAGQTDLFLITYADASAFLNNADATQTALAQNISANFSAGGLTIDGSGAWHLLLERNTDLAGQTDLFLITYADASAFLNNADATQTALPQNISANFSAGGLVFLDPAVPPPPTGVPEPPSLPTLAFAVVLLAAVTCATPRVVTATRQG
ncbi:hypothetical protein [Elioraea rosea]|uniref:hypothetical protein n=1 Tax=Elioraea rosea TaxID=2492390 RepID=UPI0011852EAD|nr:hypothetical protein [Elioraea rosea]